VRVPTLAWWPQKIAPGSRCDAVAATIDVLPTAVALAGGKVPAEPKIDGRDLTPLLLGTSQTSPREAHYYFAGYTVQAVRQGAWKLALMPQAEGLGQKAGPSVPEGPRLYNLDAEIQEQTNVAQQHPDIVQKLTGLAGAMTAEIGGRTPTARRPAGLVENPVTLYPTEPRGAAPSKKRANE
jgi:arylsulfatase A-like enzyme